MKRGYRVNNAQAYFSYRKDNGTANFNVMNMLNRGANKIGQTVLSPLANNARAAGQNARGQMKTLQNDWNTNNRNMWNKAKPMDEATSAQMQGLQGQAQQAQQRRAALGRANKKVGYGVAGAGVLGAGVGANALINGQKDQGMY